MLRNLKEEASTLTRWLTSIPSITASRGQSVAVRAIYDGLSEFTYFRKNKGNLHYISHEDQKNSSLMGFIEAYDETKDTLLILCNVDTPGPDNWGTLKPYACKSDDLLQRLNALNPRGALKQDLNDSHALFGLGVYSCKAATASVIAMVKEFSDNTMDLDFNVIFLCLSCSLQHHEGILACAPYLDTLLREKELKPLLTLTFRPNLPEFPEDRALHLYTSHLGLAEPAFFILGQGTTLANPFNGFSPTLIAAELTRALELNPAPLKALSASVLTPSFAHIFSRNQRHHQSPDAVQISFNLTYSHLDLNELTEALKEVAAKAIEDCAALTDERENLHYYMKGKAFTPAVKDAEVVSYADLFERASSSYKGNLSLAIEALLDKCRSEGLSLREMCFCVIERLTELSHLPRPSVVVFLGHSFIPESSLRSSDSHDRELLICLDNVVNTLQRKNPRDLTPARGFAPDDGNYLRPIGVDSALRALKAECPVSDHRFYGFNCPCVTLGLPGYDLGLPTERVHDSIFDYICTFVSATMDELAVLLNKRHRKPEDLPLSGEQSPALESASEEPQALEAPERVGSAAEPAPEDKKDADPALPAGDEGPHIIDSALTASRALYPAKEQNALPAPEDAQETGAGEKTAEASAGDQKAPASQT